MRSSTISTFLAPLCLALATAPGHAQQPQAPPPAPTSDPPPADAAAPTIFPHSDTTPYLILGQANIIFQAHAPFHSPYSAPNSTLSRGEYKPSLLGTLYLAYQLNRNPRFATDAILNVESSGGRGISEALGLAGFTNLDVVRNPTLGSKPYLARYQIHQVIGLSSQLADSARTPFSLTTKLPVRRLDLHIGRMSLPDFFDINSIGTDSHLQFMNWTVDNNGAWDYAANTRGYTDAAVAEYVDHAFTARYALAIMPVVANGTDLDYNLHRAIGHNIELELRDGPGGLIPAMQKRKGAIRLLGFVNKANMGDYRQQILLFQTHKTPTLDITAHPLQSTMKYGVGLNMEQEVTDSLRVFSRFGWNEGQHESYAYTEVDQTFATGADYNLKGFGRANDKFGITFVSNAIKRDHQAYLALGGQGFLLGDGKLNYAREDIIESYYNLHAWKGVYYALDAQFIDHPGYNKDRGPVLVESVRMHVDF
jgi:high affinity Mn2+ porin